MTQRVPEIYIVGTMKGGTTILFDYIEAHPRVLRGTQKEMHYFSMYADRELSWYISQFPDRPDDVFSIDASPTYFDTASMATIPAYLKKAAPNAKIILIVRDPIERAISHLEHLRTVSEREFFAEVDVDEFFMRPLERCYAPILPSDWMLSDVLAFSLYDLKFMNYVEVFGRDRILVVRNSELRGEPKATMRRVFAHCDLESYDSELIGQENYISGSRQIRLKQSTRDRLSGLLYPDYERFCRRAGIQYTEQTTS
jgi:hypothetical protein